MFVFSFSVYVNYVVFCDFVKSSYKFGIGWTATWYWYNTTLPFVTFLQWKYTFNKWMYLQLLRIRVFNNGVQDNVYATVAYFFVEPVAQL